MIYNKDEHSSEMSASNNYKLFTFFGLGGGRGILFYFRKDTTDDPILLGQPRIKEQII